MAALPTGYGRRLEVNLASPCIPWEGATTNEGYGIIQIDGRRLYVHRVAYQLHVGPIPRGWEIDHLCHGLAVREGSCEGGACMHRACRNPEHLEAVTARENSMRGNHPLYTVARNKRCKRGHDLTDPANVYIRPDGRRRCRPCQIEGQRARRSSSKR